jgi:8-oxo-dGTP pyrophosphatase MutT (NUDIX family)
MKLQPIKQIGALPWRKKKGRVEILLITSRETRRWVIPKGWPMDDRADFNAARLEAFEEAGVKGHVRRKPLGTYTYAKRHPDGDFPCIVTVYGLEVAEKLASWPERKERSRKWFDQAEAAQLVDELDLKSLISQFDKKSL